MKVVCPALAVALLAATAAGCRSGRAAVPERPATAAVDDYVKTLRSDDPRAAYALLNRSTRAQISYRAFAQLWKDSSAERAHQASALVQAISESTNVGERATVRYRDGKTVALRREGGRWRLGTRLVSLTHAEKPRQALELFLLALERHTFDRAMQLLAVERRESLERQLDSFASGLRSALEDPKRDAHLLGEDRAELRFGQGGARYRIILVREHGEWRVDDVQLREVPDEDQPEDGAEGSEKTGADEASARPGRKRP